MSIPLSAAHALCTIPGAPAADFNGCVLLQSGSIVKKAGHNGGSLLPAETNLTVLSLNLPSYKAAGVPIERLGCKWLEKGML